MVVLFFYLPVSAQTIEKQKTFVSAGHERIYYLYLPENLPEKAPLVMVLHGYGGSAKEMIEYSGMNAVADRNSFAVCYPQGNFGEDKKNSWNAGYSNDSIDDVAFLSELSGFLQKQHKLSKKNTFCTGMSNGADMCYVMACNNPELLSAIAPVAGCMMESTFENCNPEQVVPVFETHGTDDEITLWMGDSTYSDKYGGYYGTRKIIDFWLKQNECTKTARVLLPDVYKKDSSYVVAEKFYGVNTNNQVWLYTLVGGKHDWPGSWGNKDFQMAEEIWKFFEQFVANK